MRYYFHLVSDTECLRDPDGIEADNLDRAYLEARRTLQDLRDTNEADWGGWVLVAANDAGHVLFSIPLDQINYLH